MCLDFSTTAMLVLLVLLVSFEIFNIIYTLFSQRKLDKQRLKNLEAEYEKIKNEKD